jgi:hypothetical protein
MKYSQKTAHGDAGEFFFAYQIASVLKWPCRLFDIDIGVDAQVEVLEENGVSTGKFVAFQIKSTTVGRHGACSYVRKKHLAYWLDLDIPLFAVLVDLPRQVMYLHHVTKGKRYPITKKGLRLLEAEDRTASLLHSARGRRVARDARRPELERLEGPEEFALEQRYLDTVITLAQTQALSRWMYLSERV